MRLSPNSPYRSSPDLLYDHQSSETVDEPCERLRSLLHPLQGLFDALHLTVVTNDLYRVHPQLKKRIHLWIN